MDRRIFSLCRMLTLLSAFWAFEAGAVAYSLPAATFGACTGSWNAATHTCGSRVIFQPGDTLTVTTALTIRANAGFELQGNNSLGVGVATVSLVSTYGDITVGTGSRVNGPLTSGSGAIELTGTHTEGSVKGDGIGRITDSSIAGDTTFKNGLTAVRSVFFGAVTVTNGTANFTDSRVMGKVEVRNVLTAQGSEFGSTVTATNGSISLSGGSVAGRVTTNCCTVTTNQTNLEQGITAHSGISITGGVIAGDFVMTTNNNISLTGVTMTSGSIEAFNIRVSDSDLGSAETPVSLTATGNRLDILNGSTVYGSVVVDNRWGKLTIDSPSAVYGSCLAESTPGSNNNVNGECGAGAPPAVDHYELSFSTPQFSCQPIPVKIRACADSACSTTIAINHKLSMTPADRWLGDGTVTFVGTDTATAYLKRRPGTVSLGVAGENYDCRSGDCRLEIRASGFEIRIKEPNLIAGEPKEFTLQALYLDKSGACVKNESFAETERQIEFWSEYTPPESGIFPLWINNTETGKSESTATPVTVIFDSEAKNDKPLSVRYDDAGEVILQVGFVGSGREEELEMRGSKPLVSRPHGFCIRVDGPGCTDVDCPLFRPNEKTVRAGDPFDLHITPVRMPASPSLEESCVATPGFSGKLLLRSQVVIPNGFVEPLENGPLEIADYQHPPGGAYKLENQKLHEVGSFQIEVRSEGYLGFMPFGSVSEVIGRFAPAYLKAELNIPSLQAGCSAGSAGFSYQDQPIEFAVPPELTITGMSRNKSPTRNYDRGDYWKLGDQLVPALEFAAGQTQEASRLSVGLFKWTSDADHDGSRTYRMEEPVLYARPVGGPHPDKDTAFAPQLLLTMAVDELTDRDSTCHGEAGCVGLESASFGFSNPTDEIRLGRLRIGSAHGSDLSVLSLPVTAEYFDGQGYRRNELDSCTRFDPAVADAFEPSAPGGTVPVLSYPEANKDSGSGEYRLKAGYGAYLLSAPGVSGSQTIRFNNLPNWLKHDWDGTPGLDSPSGLATFGIYKGNDKIIFRREIIGR
jgi:MSHA biogenesis protein MshQ